MKTSVVNMMLLFSAGIAVLLFYEKSDRSYSGIDQVSDVLKGVDKQLHPATKIAFKDDVNRVELIHWVRYVLYPTYIDATNELDTTLILLPPNISDTAITRIIHGERTIWSKKNNEYAGYLVVKTRR